MQDNTVKLVPQVIERSPQNQYNHLEINQNYMKQNRKPSYKELITSNPNRPTNQ